MIGKDRHMYLNAPYTNKPDLRKPRETFFNLTIISSKYFPNKARPYLTWRSKKINRENESIKKLEYIFNQKKSATCIWGP